MIDSHAVLLIESDPLAAMAVRQAFARYSVPQPLMQVRSPEEAILFLQLHSVAPPSLIVMDAQCPKKMLESFLVFRHEDESLHDVPLVVITATSNEELEALRREPKIDDAIIKSSDYDEIANQVGELVKHWTGRKSATAAA